MIYAMTLFKRVRQVRAVGGVVLKEPREAANVVRLVRTKGRSTLDVRTPWLPFAVIDLLEERVDRTSHVFEYGGGGSTAWFADRVGEVVTIEQDDEWYKALAASMKDLDHVNIIPASPNNGFRDYVAAIDNYADGTFDVVLVDGRERVACVERAAPKVKPGGLLILDDSDRDKYIGAFAHLGQWSRQDHFGLVPCKDVPGHTAIWTRPYEN